MRAVLFITEHQRLARSSRLYRSVRKAPQVVDAFPSLGRFDGVVFLETTSADALNDAVVRVSRMPGVWKTEVHVEGPTKRKKGR